MTKLSSVPGNTVSDCISLLAIAAANRYTINVVLAGSAGIPKCVNDGANLVMLSITFIGSVMSRKPVRVRRRNDEADLIQWNTEWFKRLPKKVCWIESSTRAGRDGGKGNGSPDEFDAQSERSKIGSDDSKDTE
jgi:hypothetical protein